MLANEQRPEKHSISETDLEIDQKQSRFCRRGLGLELDMRNYLLGPLLLLVTM